ncbi:alpha/beta hydrolase [Altererythrobacter sp. MF3-039]|uniref:alpha/beta hydrolase n=1 Tax=Altererythrobacter sp. MF3-039 TaxID=3252901 RepID=UPI00390CC16D
MIQFATKLLLALAIAYAALSAMLYFGQERFLFPAPQQDRGSLSDYETVTYETSDGIRIAAGYRAARDGMPTLVFFHGNAADWQSGASALRGLAERGYGAFAASYRGYAGNAGKPGEQGLYLDGEAAIAWLGTQGVEPNEIILVGNSLGSGVASEMAVRHPARGLALISPFSAMSDIVAERAWWMPTSLLLRHHFENADKLADFGRPVLILHGDRDQVIPHAHAERLATVVPAARLEIIEGTGHELAYRPEAEAALAKWLAGI